MVNIRVKSEKLSDGKNRLLLPTTSSGMSSVASEPPPCSVIKHCFFKRQASWPDVLLLQAECKTAAAFNQKMKQFSKITAAHQHLNKNVKTHLFNFIYR